ncbi:MAG: hypothetical protein L0206_14850 [Actinobacteria bacterium]|nr:hypothetical protein [Actinomycetota bacterium]
MGHATSSVTRITALLLGSALAAATAVAVGLPGTGPGSLRCRAAGAGIDGPSDEPLVVLDAPSDRAAPDPGTLVQGIARHLSSDPRYGSVFVDDRAGGDALVVQTTEGSMVLPQPDDVLHPTWAPDGDLVWSTGTQLRVYDPSTGAVDTIAAPDGAIGITLPLFVGRSGLIATIEEPVDSLSSEFEGLDNLWRFDARDRAWTRLTSFRATAERWTVIRTPVLAHDGDLLFVRVRGHASRTRPPAFELWRLDDDRASLVRALDAEMYLAGMMDGSIVWNVADARGRWHLLAEEPDGSLRDIGCGRVLVDPLTRADPDVLRTERRNRPTASPNAPPTATVSAPPTTSPTVPVVDAALGILVGDFTTREEAEAMAAVIEARFGGDAIVIDATSQPTLIRSGVFAAVVALAAGVDPELELERFRTLLPQTSVTSWVVALP